SFRTRKAASKQLIDFFKLLLGSPVGKSMYAAPRLFWFRAQYTGKALSVKTRKAALKAEIPASIVAARFVPGDFAHASPKPASAVAHSTGYSFSVNTCRASS